MILSTYWKTRTDDELLQHYDDALRRRHNMWSMLVRGERVDCDRVILNNRCVHDIEAEMTSRISGRAAERAAGRASWPGQDGPEGADPGDGWAAAG